MWNNPHNMWANFALDTVYNGNWFGKWINKIDRASGSILDSITVGEAPTHIITIPIPGSASSGVLTIPFSADNDMVKVRGHGRTVCDIVDTRPHRRGQAPTRTATGSPAATGERAIVPNVFKGLGVAGSVSIMDTATGDVLREFEHDAERPAALGAADADRRGRMPRGRRRTRPTSPTPCRAWSP